MVFMPSETTGKYRKLARPYHGPYCVVSLTATNAEVKLIENPKESSIFVALDRLRKCYPEQSNATWTGRKRKSKRSSKRVQPTQLLLIQCMLCGVAQQLQLILCVLGGFA